MSRIAYWYPNRASSNETKLSEFIVGLEGAVGNTDWTWEAYTSFGKTTLLTHMKNFVWTERYANLVRQPNYGTGGAFTAQAANSTNTQDFTCTSGLPIFEPWILGPLGETIYYNDFQISDDCLTAVTARMSQRNEVEQRVTEANFQGKLADMRAGELRGAFGISSRFNESMFEPDALFLATVPASGDTNVDEVYGEVLVPVVGEFELEFGGRYSDFTTGDFQLDAKSYKALFSWGATETCGSAAAGSERTAHRTSPSCTRARRARCIRGRPAMPAARTRRILGATWRATRLARRCSSSARSSSIRRAAFPARTASTRAATTSRSTAASRPTFTGC